MTATGKLFLSAFILTPEPFAIDVEGNNSGTQPRSTHQKFKMFYIFSLDMFLHYNAYLALISVF